MKKFFERKQRQFLKTVGAVALITGLAAAPAYAGTWVQPEDQTWMYEEEESYATGWRQIDGVWYYFDRDGIMQTGWVKDADSQLWYDLDQQTGAWIVRPAMTAETAEKLLENAITKAGYYQDETDRVFVSVDYVESTQIRASVRVESDPNYSKILNNYVINKKSGIAHPDAGSNINLYEY